MFKIMTNRIIDLYTNEYIIFDCSKQEQHTKISKPEKMGKLAKYFGMEWISPMDALREQLFDYKEVDYIDFSPEN